MNIFAVKTKVFFNGFSAVDCCIAHPSCLRRVGANGVRRSLGKISVRLWKWFSVSRFCDPGCIAAALCVETLE